MSKRGVQYIKQSVPSFLKEFKDHIGYKEGPDVDTKREELQLDSGSDSEDDKPQVVVLKKGDLSHQEVESLRADGKINCDATESNEDEAESPPVDGKIRFKKPKKRLKDTEDSELNISSKNKKSKRTDDSALKRNNEKLKTKNKSLLSFNDEEEDNG